MTILNDVITFTIADFSGLSAFAQSAATAYHGNFPAFFSAMINREIEVAKKHVKTLKTADPVVDSILTGLAAADAPTLEAAAPLLVKLDELLNS